MALKDKLMTLEDFKAVRDVDVASNSAQFTEIKADLDKQAKTVDNTVLNVRSNDTISWESGSIDSGSGSFLANSKRIRSGFIDTTKLYSVKPKSGYRIEIAIYNANGAYRGMWDGVSSERVAHFYSDEIVISKLPAQSKYKIVLDYTSAINVDAYTNVEFRYLDVVTVAEKSTLNSKLDALEDLAITGNSKFVKNGNVFAGCIAASNGVLYVSSLTTKYKSKVYSLSEGTTYEISTTGNRLLYGIYDSLDNLTSPVVWANKTSEIANSQMITNFKGKYLVVYYGYADEDTFDASADCNVNVIATNERRKRHFNILVLGNSYAADAWGYVPFILYKYGITVNIYLYYRGSGSPSRLVQEWEDNSDNGLDIYGSEHIRRMTHIDTRVDRRWYSTVRGYSAKDILMFADDPTKNIDKWDIITLQPVSSEQYNVNGVWTMAPGLEPAFRQVIDLINASYDKEYTLAFFETYNRIASIGGVPVSVLDDRVATMKANEAVYRAEPFGLLLPVGAAVFSARTNALLASTDISDIGNLWATDKTHLQEGLPCYIGALTICQALFNKYFKAENYSVLGESTRITSELITSWNVQFQNGAPKTDVSELAYQLGQKCAVVANNSPFDITPIYSPSDTAEIVYERSKYWADSLIDTSNIT